MTVSPAPERSSALPRRTVFLSFLAALTGTGLLLVLLFNQSFSPAWVLFSNDSPLGMTQAYAAEAATHFWGTWLDLNWLGTTAVNAPPSLTALLFLGLGGTSNPHTFANFYAPISLLFLAFAAWMLFRQLRFDPWVCGLGAIAAALNSDPFSYACWGLPSLPLGMAWTFLALAALANPHPRRRWIQLVLAGFAVGMSIVESFDNGAIFSVYVAAFAVFQSLNQQTERPFGARLGRGIGWVAVVALCAAFMAAHTLSSLLSTQIQGVVGMAQDKGTRVERWNEATQWSLPRNEALRIVVAGLHGYRMDTADGGKYWGGVGRDAAWDDYLQQRNPDPNLAPRRILRHSGAGFYGGVLVALVAVWALTQAFRGRSGPYDDRERRIIYFWGVTAAFSLLMAFGRHAPLYQLFYYGVPYFSTIRNPIKFLHPFHIAWLILFAWGLQGLWRRYVHRSSVARRTAFEQLSAWWRAGTCPERRWLLGAGVVTLALIAAALLFAGKTAALVQYLQLVGFPDLTEARQIAAASVREVGWSLVFLVLGLAWIALVMSGALSGPRVQQCGLIVAVILIVDLVRADLPWITYYDLQKKYASNPIIDQLKVDSADHRVSGRLLPFGQIPLANDPVFPAVYNEWLEHLFQFHRVQCLDVIQMPRVPELDAAFRDALVPTSPTNLFPVGRMWQLSNTRYLLGSAGYLDTFNQQIDPAHRPFRIRTTFNWAPKPGVDQPRLPEDLTVVVQPNGPYALFEMTNALPRAALYSRWEVSTNDPATLQRLADPAFDPTATVLVSGPIDPSPSATTTGTNNAVIEAYRPKYVRIRAASPDPTLLLLNDRYHPDWRVTVDGQPQALLRCNYIMRGVHLAPGPHVVEFRFAPEASVIFISLAAVAIGLVLCLYVALTPRHRPNAALNPGTPSA